MKKFDEAASRVVRAEMEDLEKAILSDLAGMIGEAHTIVRENNIFAGFNKYLNGRDPKNKDLLRLDKMISDAIMSENPKILEYLNIDLEIDRYNPKMIGLQFTVNNKKII